MARGYVSYQQSKGHSTSNMIRQAMLEGELSPIFQLFVEHTTNKLHLDFVSANKLKKS